MTAPTAGPPQTAAIFAKQMRRVIIEQAMRAGVGHIGSALSVTDLVAALYDGALTIVYPDDPDRDRFVLSKGHAALALYAALHLRGWISTEMLDTFCGDGSLLGVHPEHQVCGVDFTTGSLGQGLSLGAGAALAARLQGSARRAFVLMSDAECNEGAVWEAAMFAAHHRLGNLVALVDLNGQQALGYTRDVLDLSPMVARWRAFGWDVHEVDGHDVGAIADTIAALETHMGPPHIIVAHTIFGNGVSFMEREIKWHYLPLTVELCAVALAEIGADG